MENNLMWQEINQIKDVIPDQHIEDIDTNDRQAFYKDGVNAGLASGDYDKAELRKDISTSKKYKGPQIKPLVPNYIAD